MLEEFCESYINSIQDSEAFDFVECEELCYSVLSVGQDIFETC